MDLLHLPMLCAHARGAEAHRLRVSVFCVSVGAQSQPLVLAWDNDERGVSKAYRPHSRAFGFKAGRDHLRLLASPAQDSKAGTPVGSGGQGGGGAELRSDVGVITVGETVLVAVLVEQLHAVVRPD